MTSRSGDHEWLDQIDALRCRDPAWHRITILLGERMTEYSKIQGWRATGSIFDRWIQVAWLRCEARSATFVDIH